MGVFACINEQPKRLKTKKNMYKNIFFHNNSIALANCQSVFCLTFHCMCVCFLFIHLLFAVFFFIERNGSLLVTKSSSLGFLFPTISKRL